MDVMSICWFFSFYYSNEMALYIKMVFDNGYYVIEVRKLKKIISILIFFIGIMFLNIFWFKGKDKEDAASIQVKSVENQLYELYDMEEDYKGIEIYHLEFWNTTDSKYIDASYKYSNPVKTTLGELNDDFPIDKKNMNNIATPQCDINIKVDEEIWVYASCDSLYDGENVKLHYNKLDIYENGADIKTEFVRKTGGGLSDRQLIVLSIIPVNQPVTDLWNGGENYELEFLVDGRNSFEYKRYKKLVKEYEEPKKTTVGQLNKEIQIINRNSNPICTPMNKFELLDNEEIWVYASCLDNYNGEKIRFVYDDINIYEDSLEIKTRFEGANNTNINNGDQSIIVFSIIPVNQPVTDLCKNIKNYELEFLSPVKNDNGDEVLDFDIPLLKYQQPVKTTVRELNEDFPLDYANKRNLVTPIQEFDLKLDDEIWVYASYYDSYRGGPLMMKYDVLEISEQELLIQTHFEMGGDFSSSAVARRIIVISVIPVKQN